MPHPQSLSLPYDERRYKTDAAYNLALGKAYYQKQLADFGDPIKAAAAYNAGPGSVKEGTGLRGAMAKARAAGRPEAWAEYLPGETRDYTKKFGTLSNDPTVRQTPQRHDLNQLLARTDIQAEQQGWSFERREAAKSEIERRVRRDEQLVERQESAADRAAPGVYSRKGRWLYRYQPDSAPYLVEHVRDGPRGGREIGKRKASCRNILRSEFGRRKATTLPLRPTITTTSRCSEKPSTG